MQIIKIEANENGVRPPVQNWKDATPPNGYVHFPDEFLPIFYPPDKQAAGFVTIEHDGTTVTSCVWSEEAYQAYLASLPEPVPPEPTEEERLRADMDYLAIMTGVEL